MERVARLLLSENPSRIPTAASHSRHHKRKRKNDAGEKKVSSQKRTSRLCSTYTPSSWLLTLSICKCKTYKLFFEKLRSIAVFFNDECKNKKTLLLDIGTSFFEYQDIVLRIQKHTSDLKSMFLPPRFLHARLVIDTVVQRIYRVGG